jgi:UDP-4-amino-4,6-dideoxy-N-acetyl-beta-L-altrosamine transaminase
MVKMMRKRKISYGRQTITKDDIKAVTDVLRSDWLSQGPKIREFEEALCRYTGAKYAVAVSNGTAALHMACLAAGIAPGDEVITSPVTFLASANCVVYCGGTPVFADIDEETVNIDPAAIEKKISARTKALIPVHFAGHPADMAEIRRVARKRKLLVIEDACHALGAEYRGKKIGGGAYSDMTVFSFHPVKNITTGEGGAILTNRKDLYERLQIFRTHGMTKAPRLLTRNDGPWYYEMPVLGYNYRITDLQCALGVSQLRKLDRFLDQRRTHVETYHALLAQDSRFILPVEKKDVKAAWHIFVIQFKDAALRDRTFQSLLREGILPQVHYIPIHLQPYYQKRFGYRRGQFPFAEQYYERAMTLPLYPQLRKCDVRHVVQTLIKVLA